MTERGAADREEAVGIGIQLGRATSAPTVPHQVRLKRIGLRTTGRAHSFSFGSSHDPDQLIKKNIRQQAYFRGEDILVTSLLPAEFRERQHELTTIVKRLSSTAVIADVDRRKYGFELQQYQSRKPDEIPPLFQSSSTSGLTVVSAQMRFKEKGPNIVDTTRPIPWWVNLLQSFFRGFAPLLWVACFLVFLSWRPFGSPPTNVYNLALAVVLLIVIVVSGLFTFFQELQATRILAGFLELIPQKCCVIRGGIPRNIQVSELVVGDLVILEQGARVPADIRLIAAAQMKLDKSTLTGESEPVSATSEAEQSPDSSLLTAANICFVGCTVVEGHGRGIVIATGADTQLAKIAEQAAKGSRRSRITTLQAEINRFVGIIAFFACLTGVAVILTWAFWLQVEHPTFMSVSTMLANAISVIVAFVPEGLPLALSMGLNIIARRLCATHFVLIKRLGTIETVGSMSMLASDKTGTLTENRMTVANVIGGVGVPFTDADFSDALDAEEPVFQRALIKSPHRMLTKPQLPSDIKPSDTNNRRGDKKLLSVARGEGTMGTEYASLTPSSEKGRSRLDSVDGSDEIQTVTALELPWLQAILVTAVLCNDAHLELKSNNPDIRTQHNKEEEGHRVATCAAGVGASGGGDYLQCRDGMDIEGILSDIESKESRGASNKSPSEDLVAIGSNSTDRVILTWAHSILSQHEESVHLLRRRRAAELLRLQREKRSPRKVSPCIFPDGDGSMEDLTPSVPHSLLVSGRGGSVKDTFEDVELGEVGNGIIAGAPAAGLWADTDEELSELLFTLGYPSPEYQRKLALRAEQAAAAAREFMSPLSFTPPDDVPVAATAEGTHNHSEKRSSMNEVSNAGGANLSILLDSGGRQSSSPTPGTGGATVNGPQSTFPAVINESSTTATQTAAIHTSNQKVKNQKKEEALSVSCASPSPPSTNRHVGAWFQPASSSEERPQSGAPSPTGFGSPPPLSPYCFTGGNMRAAGNYGPYSNSPSPYSGILSSIDNIKSNYEVVSSSPFSSTTKIAYTYVRRRTDGAIFVLAKGAPEFLLKQCTHYYTQMSPAVCNHVNSSSPFEDSPHVLEDCRHPTTNKYAAFNGIPKRMTPMRKGNHGRARMTDASSNSITASIVEECQRGQRVVALAISGPHWIGIDADGKEIYLSPMDLVHKLPSVRIGGSGSNDAEGISSSVSPRALPQHPGASPLSSSVMIRSTDFPREVHLKRVLGTRNLPGFVSGAVIDKHDSEEKFEEAPISPLHRPTRPMQFGSHQTVGRPQIHPTTRATYNTPFDTKLIPTGGLTLACCLSISDPPRPGARDAVLALRKAGIVIAMVTGDSPTTALAVAKQVGIVGDVHDASTEASETNYEDRVAYPAVAHQDSAGAALLVQCRLAAAQMKSGDKGQSPPPGAESKSGNFPSEPSGSIDKIREREGEWVASRNRGSRVFDNNTSPLHSRTSSGSHRSNGSGEEDRVTEVDLSYESAGAGAGSGAGAGACTQQPLQDPGQSPVQMLRRLGPMGGASPQPIVSNTIVTRDQSTQLIRTAVSSNILPAESKKLAEDDTGGGSTNKAGVDVLSSPKYASLFASSSSPAITQSQLQLRLDVNQYSGLQSRGGPCEPSSRGTSRVAVAPRSRRGSREESTRGYAAVQKNLNLYPLSKCIHSTPPANVEKDSSHSDIEDGRRNGSLVQTETATGGNLAAQATSPFQGFFNMSRSASQSASMFSGGLFTLSAITSGFDQSDDHTERPLEMRELGGNSSRPHTAGDLRAPAGQSMSGRGGKGYREGHSSHHGSDVSNVEDSDWEPDDDETEGYLSDGNYLRDLDPDDDGDDGDNMADESGHFSHHSYASRRSRRRGAPTFRPENSAVLVEGSDLALLTDAGWDFIFAHTEMVFARTTPDQKLQIVKESQRRGHRVGVTGDGVNDAPALKRADVGIAMNSGSDAAKDVSSIVLLNSDFSSIVPAVSEGRLIFSNLRKVIAYQISAGGWSELLPVLSTFFLGMPQPLSSFLMIIISCLTDVYAGVALMNEPPEEDILRTPPRDIRRSHLVDWKLIVYAYLFYANMICIGAFYNYFDYMATRGSRSSLPTPLPADDELFSTPSDTGVRSFPAGYSPNQILFAWNWGADPDSALGRDERAAMNVGSSVFFVAIVLGQMGHLLSIRRKSPYFADFICRHLARFRRCDKSNRATVLESTQAIQKPPRSGGQDTPADMEFEGRDLPRLGGIRANQQCLEPAGLDCANRGSLDSVETTTTGSIGPFMKVNTGFASDSTVNEKGETDTRASAKKRGVTFESRSTEASCNDDVGQIYSWGTGVSGNIRWSILFAWMGSIATAVLVTEVPFFQQYCGTGSVPAKYWLLAAGWSAAWFMVAEVRKWIIFLLPNSIVGKAVW